MTGHLRKTPKTADRVAELEDELKQRDRRIEKLKHELDEARDLVRRKRRKRGESLQHIADETSLGMQTVRTIIGKANGTDRTTGKHLARIKPEDMAAWRARKRTPRPPGARARHSKHVCA